MTFFSHFVTYISCDVIRAFSDNFLKKERKSFVKEKARVLDFSKLSVDDAFLLLLPEEMTASGNFRFHKPKTLSSKLTKAHDPKIQPFLKKKGTIQYFYYYVIPGDMSWDLSSTFLCLSNPTNQPQSILQVTLAPTQLSNQPFFFLFFLSPQSPACYTHYFSSSFSLSFSTHP